MKSRLGWHNRGYLHHFDGYGVAQHIVLRTRASLSSEILQQVSTMDVAQARSWVDVQLDHSINGRIFADAKTALVMEDILRYFDGDRFDLLAWCIMPNHIHALIVVLGNNRLGNIVRTWKIQASKRLGGGQIFTNDYFDRFIRNSKHMATTLAYIENNPVKAALCREASEWQWSSASKKALGWEPNTSNCPVFLS